MKKTGRADASKQSIHRGLLGSVEVRRTRNSTKLTISLQWPKITAFRGLAQAFFGLFVLSLGMVGVFTVARPYFTPQVSSTEARAISPSVNQQEELPKIITMQRSEPVHLSVASIGLETDLLKTGKNDIGELAVPDRYDVAAWYELSPTPGELGASILVGHSVGVWSGAIFENINKMSPGSDIKVQRADGSVAQFKVESVAEYPQNSFPTSQVYGDLDYAGLRLITCGGAYNILTGRYTNNVVVYARLIT